VMPQARPPRPLKEKTNITSRARVPMTLCSAERVEALGSLLLSITINIGGKIGRTSRFLKHTSSSTHARQDSENSNPRNNSLM
jgi:hypothetical protein